ncbi:hypothetical protein D3C78_1329850 [compost metagenome]
MRMAMAITTISVAVRPSLLPSVPLSFRCRGYRVIAMISDQSIRLRNGRKIWKQNITSTAIRPARIRTSSRPRDSAWSEVGVGCIDSLLAGSSKAACAIKKR